MRRIKYNSKQPMLFAIGDTHIDHPNTDMQLLQKHVNMIQEINAPWIHLGDWVDAIGPTDRRYSIEDKRASIVEGYLRAEEMFNPISEQCVGILRGNHGSKWSRIEGDMISVLAKRWNILYLGYCGLIDFRYGKQSYKIWVHHGAGGGRKRGAKAIRLQDWSQFVDADVYLQGHTHTYVNFVDEVITYKGMRRRWFANVPGYIKSYRGHDNYIEELGLPPQPVGMVCVFFNDGKRDVTIDGVFE